MHALMLAALLLKCDGGFHTVDDVKLERLKRPDVSHARRYEFDRVTVYSRIMADDQMRLIRFTLRQGTTWWTLEDREEILTADKPEAITVKTHGGLLLLAYSIDWLGGNTFGWNRKTIVVDVSGKKPRVAKIVVCSEAFGGGACTAPWGQRLPDHSLACDENLRCISRAKMMTEWSTRTGTRTFDLLTNKTIPRAPRIYRVSSNITARHVRGAALTYRFFYRGKEIPTVVLSDAGYRFAPEFELRPDYEPDGPTPTFFGKDLGNGVVEVTVSEEEGRAVFWIGPEGALRVAADAPEFRHCDDAVFPPSVYAIDGRIVHVLPSIRRNELREKKLERRCESTGTIEWVDGRGWIARWAPIPCSDPVTWPWTVLISGDGVTGLKRSTSFHP